MRKRVEQEQFYNLTSGGLEVTIQLFLFNCIATASNIQYRVELYWFTTVKYLAK